MKAVIFVLALLFFMSPSAMAIPSTPLYNCTNGYLLTNVTAWMSGSLIELFVYNETCAFGCADNGLECNSPLNVDQTSVGMNAALFMVMAVIFLYLSQKMQIVNKKYYVLKYLFFSLTFIYMMLAVGLLGGSFVFGQDNLSAIIWSGWYVLMFAFLFMLLMIFVSEAEEYVKSLKKAGRL